MLKKTKLTARAVKVLAAFALAFAQMTPPGLGDDKTKPPVGGVPTIQHKNPSAKSGAGGSNWNIDAKIIEACSCPLFCSSFFNGSPTKHFCRFNDAVKVLSGQYAGIDLTGVKFWISGDLGDSIGQGSGVWAALTFDPSAKKEQVEAVCAIFPHIYPFKFEQTFVDKKPISWEMEGDQATAKIGDGTDGMIELTAFKDKSTGKTAVVKNLNYFGALQNRGFELYKSKHHYKGNGHEYAFEDASGFVIQIYSYGDLPQAHY